MLSNITCRTPVKNYPCLTSLRDLRESLQQIYESKFYNNVMNMKPYFSAFSMKVSVTSCLLLMILSCFVSFYLALSIPFRDGILRPVSFRRRKPQMLLQRIFTGVSNSIPETMLTNSVDVL